MEKYVSILRPNMIFSFLGSIFLLIAVYFALTEREYLKREKKYKRTIANNHLVIRFIFAGLIIYMAIYRSYSSATDYIKKDFVLSDGTITKFNSDYKEFSYKGVQINQEVFQLPYSFYPSLDVNDKVKFIYAKRTRIILDIERVP